MNQTNPKKDNLYQQIFVSYMTSREQEVANLIEQNLHQIGLNTFNLSKFNKSEYSWLDKIKECINSGDYLLLIISSESISSRYFLADIKYFNKLVNFRNITVLPILIDYCIIPDTFASYQIFDFRDHSEEKIKDLCKKISLTKFIDFSKLNGKTFEQLSKDLLEEIDFTLIENSNHDQGFDIIAKYCYLDPFKVMISETWLVECKLYRDKRPSLSVVEQISHSILNFPMPAKGLIITNSFLTSVSKQWLTSFSKEKHIYIRLIEETELKRLLLQHENIVEKYFLHSNLVLT